MDAASAARMSDPQENPSFRRRWREVADERAPKPSAPSAATMARLDRLAELLRAEWRRRTEHGPGGAS
jgi:hypothetical protein